MANIGIYGYKNMLDWSLKAAAPATPAGIFIGLSLGGPTTTLSSEIAVSLGYTRQSGTFAAAATPTGSASASNSNICSFGTFSSSMVLSGIFVSDTVSSGAGSMLWYGTISPIRTPLPGDQVLLSAGNLSITLA